jgi:hypothetical protein
MTTTTRSTGSVAKLVGQAEDRLSRLNVGHVVLKRQDNRLHQQQTVGDRGFIVAATPRRTNVCSRKKVANGLISLGTFAGLFSKLESVKRYFRIAVQEGSQVPPRRPWLGLVAPACERNGSVGIRVPANFCLLKVKRCSVWPSGTALCAPKLSLIAQDKPGLSRTDLIQSGQALRFPGSNRPRISIPVGDDALT